MKYDGVIYRIFFSRVDSYFDTSEKYSIKEPGKFLGMCKYDISTNTKTAKEGNKRFLDKEKQT